MYNYIFYTVYRYNIKDGKTFARINASIVVGVAFASHFSLLFVLLKTAFPDVFRNILPSLNRAVGAIFFVALFGLIYIYYNSRRLRKIILKRGEIIIPVGLESDVLKVVLILFIPIFASMIIGWDRGSN